MLFAALDFLHYRRRTGRFGDDQRSVMSLGFLGQLPDDVIADLESDSKLYQVISCSCDAACEELD
jgi:hypothetical protein